MPRRCRITEVQKPGCRVLSNVGTLSSAFWSPPYAFLVRAAACTPLLTVLEGYVQASTHVTLWLRSWHVHTPLQYTFSLLVR